MHFTMKPISLPSLVEELTEVHFTFTSTESKCMHGAKFLAITNNTNNYAGVRQFADWSKTAVMFFCTQAAGVVKISSCMHASLHIV